MRIVPIVPHFPLPRTGGISSPQNNTENATINPPSVLFNHGRFAVRCAGPKHGSPADWPNFRPLGKPLLSTLGRQFPAPRCGNSEVKVSLPPQSPGRADGKLEEAIQHSTGRSSVY
jgi:hypothetical protein